MKRLLAQIGITYFSVLAIAFYLPEKAVWILLSASVLAAAVLLIIRKTRRRVFIPLIALTIAVGCAVNIGYTYFKVRPAQALASGSEKRVEATLTDEPYKAYSKYYYRLRADAIDGKSTDVSLLLKTAVPIGIEPYDTITFTADIGSTENRYYLSKGYYLTVNTYDRDFVVSEAGSRPLYYHIIQLRRSLRDALDEFLPQDAADLCKAVFVGDKYALSADVKEDFRYAGASYFVVVSGMHFAIICLLVYRLLKSLRVNRFISVGATLCLILLYMAVTGFQPSVVRSGVMMIVYMIGRLIRRIGDPHSSLGLAGIVSTFVFSPYGAGDIGLILSFAATFAIITWSDPICRRLSAKTPDTLPKKAWNAFARVLSASIAANLLVFPISVYVFSAFSTVTLVSAVLLYIPIESILILSLALCLFFYLGPLRYFSLLLSWPLYALCRFVLWIIDGLASLPFSYVHIGHDFFYLWMGVTLVLGAAVILLRRYRLLPYAALLSAILLIGGTVWNAAAELNTVALYAYACGDGLTVGLDCHGSLYLFSFTAESYDAYRILDSLSSRYHGAELAVCSGKREYNNYSRLSDQEFAIRRYLLYDKDNRYVDTMIPYDAADVYRLDDGVTLEVAERYGKLLSFLRVGDTTILIIPSKFPYRNIPEAFRTADIIVLSQPSDGYGQLTCDTLIVSNTGDDLPAITAIMQDSCREIRCTGGEDVSIRLE